MTGTHEQFMADLRAELADLPPDPDTEARGIWDDAVADRYDPLLGDDVPLNYDPKRWGAGL